MLSEFKRSQQVQERNRGSSGQTLFIHRQRAACGAQDFPELPSLYILPLSETVSVSSAAQNHLQFTTTPTWDRLQKRSLRARLLVGTTPLLPDDFSQMRKELADTHLGTSSPGIDTGGICKADGLRKGRYLSTRRCRRMRR